MKEKESTQVKETSVIRRLIENRKLTEETYIGLTKSRFRTAEDRRINDFNRLLTDGKKKEGE